MEVYVIQIGTRPEGEAATSRGELRGTVEHVGSGHREPFRDARELLAFLHSEHKPQPRGGRRAMKIRLLVRASTRRPPHVANTFKEALP